MTVNYIYRMQAQLWVSFFAFSKIYINTMKIMLYTF
jgi:hypothetical protein